MGRDVNRKRVGISVDKILYDELENLSLKLRTPKSRLFDEALEYLMQKHNVDIEDYNYRFKL